MAPGERVGGGGRGVLPGPPRRPFPSPAGERTARVIAGYRRTAGDRSRGQAQPFRAAAPERVALGREPLVARQPQVRLERLRRSVELQQRDAHGDAAQKFRRRSRSSCTPAAAGPATPPRSRGAPPPYSLGSSQAATAGNPAIQRSR